MCLRVSGPALLNPSRTLQGTQTFYMILAFFALILLRQKKDSLRSRVTGLPVQSSRVSCFALADQTCLINASDFISRKHFFVYFGLVSIDRELSYVENIHYKRLPLHFILMINCIEHLLLSEFVSDFVRISVRLFKTNFPMP
uniref:Uncharacterized protein n=1 Tax=Glossina brevipalpis TaxID=37001 RepID=A0A1A9W3D8_9MUSC